MNVSNGAPLVAVKLTPVGRSQTFLPADPAVTDGPRVGDRVVVQTESGTAIGTVVRRIPQLDDKRRPAADSPQRVVRLATRDDIVARLKQQHREQEAFRIALLKIRDRGLGMKLARVEHAFDGSKLVFFFTADGRVDFRELVRELAAEFRTRIEMRQIGVRDEAKIYGGYGSCGRPLCCTTFLQSFEPVSIKMAKQQDLSLNPSKLSGLCGRLKCCLRYELPNAKGITHGGCGSEGGCDNPSGCGSGGGCGSGSCGSGGCGSCGSK
jgi:cell fate regulator YaaT (PSP1 superfamily)